MNWRLRVQWRASSTDDFRFTSFLRVVRSQRFRTLLAELPGYSTSHTGEIRKACIMRAKGWMRSLVAGMAAVGIAFWTGTLRAADASKRVLTVFAASSASDCMMSIGRQYEAVHGVKVRLNLASSSVLARQIEESAPCDIFLSADQEWMDYLAGRNRIQAASRQDILGNRLVIITPTNRLIAVRMERDFDFPKSFSGRLAVGDPAHVPAGKYARDALRKLGWWDALQNRLAPAENVRAALKLVERGDTDAGIVYATDALSTKGVSVAAVFPEDTHAPIRYPVALCTGAGAGAAELLEYLTGAEAVTVWTHAGFAVVAPGVASVSKGK